MKTLMPAGKRIGKNSTHIAILNNDKIEIWVIGLAWTNDDGSKSIYPPEKLWTIPASDRDDLFAIFERLDEDNRCNVAEANLEFLNYK